MWSDNETQTDYLNFTSVSDTVAEIIVQAEGRPISVGVSGAWGTGKSSMIRLIQASLSNTEPQQSNQEFVFVEFSAWLYQGYDDARAALVEVIATKLQSIAEENEKALDKVKTLLKRVNWLRAAKLTASSAIALSLGLPPASLFTQIWGVGRRFLSGDVDEGLIQEGTEVLGKVRDATSSMLEPEIEPTSPPKEIHAIRSAFEEALEELGVTLVVLVDDLDRCLPETTISTLEAMRLFLFIENTAFVIAADTDVIKLAVRRHFATDGHEADNRLVTSYFDKLVQVPIQVPPLGIQEVRAYMMLLFVEDSELSDDLKEGLRQAVCDQLRISWQGNRVDRTFMSSLHEDYPSDLISRFEVAERLAPAMVSTSGVSGNPRLIKRFLNALSIRLSIARAQGVSVDEAVLAKMLLLERHGGGGAFNEIVRSVTTSTSGKPEIISQWEKKAIAGEDLSLDPPFNDQFLGDWLTLPPALADLDLRGAIYVSREHVPPVTVEDSLSGEAIELLQALLEHPRMATNLKSMLSDLTSRDRQFIMDKLLENARRENSWGVPDILEACLVLTESDPEQGERLATFLVERPPSQIRPDIVPRISYQPWCLNVYDTWYERDVSAQVKSAITRQKKKQTP